jgi:hypothetical protein
MAAIHNNVTYEHINAQASLRILKADNDDDDLVALLANLGHGRPLQGCETYLHDLRMLSHNSPVIEGLGDPG